MQVKVPKFTLGSGGAEPASQLMGKKSFESVQNLMKLKDSEGSTSI